MNEGSFHYRQGDYSAAIQAYLEASAEIPQDPDVHLNLANCLLAQDASQEALQEAQKVLDIEATSAAAHFIMGSAYLRLQQSQEAIKHFEQSIQLDPSEPASHFQMGVAHMGMDHHEEALSAFQSGIGLEPNRIHARVRYLMAQCLLRLGREEEAEVELQWHQAHASTAEGSFMEVAFERSSHTQARVPFALDQPNLESNPMVYEDATSETIGLLADAIQAPVTMLDANQDGQVDLLCRQEGVGWQWLAGNQGVFDAQQGGSFAWHKPVSKVLVGDLQNDRRPDLVLLGREGSGMFSQDEEGVFQDQTSTGALSDLRSREGVLVDLDFMGRLDVVAIDADEGSLVGYRQTEPSAFEPLSRDQLPKASDKVWKEIHLEDWNRDQVMDLVVQPEMGKPTLHPKKRGGGWGESQELGELEGALFVTGDWDNDLRVDGCLHKDGALVFYSQGGSPQEITLDANLVPIRLIAVDHDQDGWLDLWVIGNGVQVWRNQGLAGFVDQTEALGLGAWRGQSIAELHHADLDGDCDLDVLMVMADSGVRLLRNQGGNVNGLIKVQMVGNRSNADGIGCKIEIKTGGLRLIRTVRQWPVEIGIGDHQVMDSFMVHWFNWAQGSAQVPILCDQPVLAYEQTIQEGSCPYLYVWNGERFEFVSDFLGAAPLGLPLAQGKLIAADPEELLWVGNESTFLPREGGYEIRITEELKEVLYLDEAKLVVVDHPSNQEVYSTDKLLPKGPFPPGKLESLIEGQPLRHALDMKGEDVTSQLLHIDGSRFSPDHLKASHFRGWAEPYGCELDFGVLDGAQPWVLVLHGWLRFGGGMANMAASLDTSLPYPFPRLEAELAAGQWMPLEVTAGAPAGKTKTILVDLEGVLPARVQRLRWSSAFEIHLDQAKLMLKAPDRSLKVHRVSPDHATLRFRGFSERKPLPWDWPLTPDYQKVQRHAVWTISPQGWLTRHGEVKALIDQRDEALLTMSCGDELQLRFSTRSIPIKEEGMERSFFIQVDGWDKDADYHVVEGRYVGPLPFHGMDDQAYGKEKRPEFPSDHLHRQYHTRWMEGVHPGPRPNAVSLQGH